MVQTIPREGETRDWSVGDYIGRGRGLYRLFKQSTLQLRGQRLTILLGMEPIYRSIGALVSSQKRIAFLSSALKRSVMGAKLKL